MSDPSVELAPRTDQTPFEFELATLLVTLLNLEIQAADISPTAPLFNQGLGLDSIDALELALAISRRYGIELRSDDERNGAVFASLRALAAHVAAQAAPGVIAAQAAPGVIAAQAAPGVIAAQAEPGPAAPDARRRP